VTNISPKAKEPQLLAIGNAIRALRKARGLTQESLAAAAGLNLSYLSAVERGENNPTVTTLIAVSGALDISLTKLVTTAGL
jgi:transcriptional regulator with XRE-family HTH domain